MNKWKEHMQGNKILYRMIAGYTLLSTLIIILMTTFLYNSFKQELQSEIFRSQEQSIQQISNTVSFRAEYANYLMQQAMLDKQISQLFYMNRGVTNVEAMNRLQNMRISVKQLYSVYIYNEYEDTIYCSWERTMSNVAVRDEFEDQGFVDMLDNIDQYSKFTPYLRMVSIETPSGQRFNTYVYTYLIFDAYSSGSVKNIMAFNFHLGWMDDALDFITNSKKTSEDFWIVDKDRQIVYAENGSLIGTVSTADVLPGEVYSQKSGYIITGTGNDKKMLVYATPDHNGYEDWTFLSWNDYSALLAPMQRVRGFVYIICFIALIISALVIIFVSMEIYKPVRKTMDKVESLEMEQAKKLKIDKMLYLRKLFQGNEEDDIQKIKDNFVKYKVDYEPDEDIRILMLSVDYGNSFLRKFGREMERIDSFMEGLMEGKLGGVYPKVISVKMQDGAWGVCIPAAEDGQEEKQNEELYQLFSGMNEVVDGELGITISMAVTKMGHSVRDIPYLYSAALNLLSYRYLLGQNKMITEEDIMKQGLKKFDYPHEVEKKLLSNLFAGKNNETLDAFNEFVQEVQSFPVGEIKLSFMLLAYAIKNASLNTIAETSSILMEFDQFYKKLQNLETIGEVEQLFIHLISEIVSKLQVYSRERHELLINQIKEYVSNNYGQISLSMNEVSDYVDMSAAYLGRLFKQVTGTTFTEYLSRFRLQTACKLLEETEMTVNEISDEVGFTNSSYFYIVFKKNLGCTPNQYRKQQGPKTEDSL